MQVISRAEARTDALPRFFTGLPCKNGHVAERVAVSGACYGCLSAAAARYRARNIDAVRAHDAKLQRKIRAAKAVAAGRKPGVHARGKVFDPALQALKARARVHNRRVNLGAPITAEVIAQLRERQKGRCSFCLQRLAGEKENLDHYIPIKLGGTNETNNLRLLHAFCNKSKGAKHPLDYGVSRGLLCW